VYLNNLQNIKPLCPVKRDISPLQRRASLKKGEILGEKSGTRRKDGQKEAVFSLGFTLLSE